MQVIQLDKNLVNLAVGKLAHYILVLVVWLLAGGGIMVATGLTLVILVHEVIFVVGIVAANVNVAQRVGECIGRRSLEVLQKGLECTWKSSWSVRLSREIVGDGRNTPNWAS